MQVQLPLRCPSCGTVVGIGGGRCPTCGYLLPEDLPRKPAATASRPPPQPPKPARGPVIVLIGAIVLSAIALAFVVRARIDRQASAPLTPAPVASPVQPSAAVPVGKAELIDVSNFSAGAAARAAAWHADALLVSVEAFPVHGSKVDVTGEGFIELTYGKPTKSRLGPGAPLTTSRLVIRVDHAGSRETPRTDARPSKGLAEPDCPVEEVSRVVTASGVPTSAPLRLHYGASDRHGRPVWRATTDDPSHTRNVDGKSCAVLPK